MIIPFNKSLLVNMLVMLTLMSLVSFLLLDLRYMQKALNEIRLKRRLVIFSLQDIKKNSKYSNITKQEPFPLKR